MSVTKNQKYEYKIPSNEIEKFKTTANGVEFRSPFFELDRFRWALCIYPNGYNKSKVGNVNVFVMLRSLPPMYSKITAKVTLSLEELNITATFPHSFTDNALSRGWITGTLKTADIQSLSSLTFGVDITVHDVYSITGQLVSESDGDGDAKTDSVAELRTSPRIIRQSSALVLDPAKAAMDMSRLDALSVRIEELCAKYDAAQRATHTVTVQQADTQQQMSGIVEELHAMRQFLGKDYKGSDRLVTAPTEDQKKIKAWLESFKMEAYFARFVHGGCDNFHILKLLSMDNLESIGVDKLGHRVQILHEIAKLHQMQQTE